MPRRAARDDDDASGLEKLVLVVAYAGKDNVGAFGVDPAADTVDDRAGLFVNLFEHEVRETSFFELADIHLQHLDVQGLHHVIERYDLERFVSPDDGHLFVIEIHYLFGMFDNRRGVRSEKTLVAPDADHQRAAFARCHDQVWILFLYNCDRIGADHFVQGQLHRRAEIAMVSLLDVLDQLYQYFCIGVALEGVVVVAQHFAQYVVVLDNAVVDNSEGFRLRIVRVRICVVWFAMRGPAGVRDPDGARNVLALGGALQVGDFAFGFEYIQRSVFVYQRDARTVISPVFQSAQTLDQHRIGRPVTEVTYNSAHALNFLVLLLTKITFFIGISYLYRINKPDEL